MLEVNQPLPGLADSLSSIEEFNNAFGLDKGKINWLATWDKEQLLVGLIYEELDELRNALSSSDIKEVFDACGDLLYVVLGFCVRFEIPIEEIFNRVHKSNMSKLGEDGKPIYREDGKVLKGPNFKLPDFTDLIEQYGDMAKEIEF